MKKMTLAIIVITVLLFGMNLLLANAETIASGNCGDNLTWTLDDAGTLTISGTGAMDDYTMMNEETFSYLPPWDSFEEKIKAVVIEDDVTTIGEYAFSNCIELERITIGDSVTTIGDGAFFFCNYITSINIPASVTAIGYDAFECAGIENLYIADIAAWCEIEFNCSFYNPLICYAQNIYFNGKLVRDLVIPSDITEIKPYSFSGARFNSVTICGDVTTIGRCAFYFCGGLKTVCIGENVTTIEESAFESDSISQVEYEGNESDWENIDIYEGGNVSITILNSVNCNSPLFHKNAVTNNISVIKTDKTTEWSFAIEVERQTAGVDYIYVGIYNGNGKMLGINKAEIAFNGTASIDITKVDGAAYARVFAWHNYQPLAPEEKIDL